MIRIWWSAVRGQCFCISVCMLVWLSVSHSINLFVHMPVCLSSSFFVYETACLQLSRLCVCVYMSLCISINLPFVCCLVLLECLSKVFLSLFGPSSVTFFSRFICLFAWQFVVDAVDTPPPPPHLLCLSAAKCVCLLPPPPRPFCLFKSLSLFAYVAPSVYLSVFVSLSTSDYPPSRLLPPCLPPTPPPPPFFFYRLLYRWAHGSYLLTQ